jgi:hypothetical protein
VACDYIIARLCTRSRSQHCCKYFEHTYTSNQLARSLSRTLAYPSLTPSHPFPYPLPSLTLLSSDPFPSPPLAYTDFTRQLIKAIDVLLDHGASPERIVLVAPIAVEGALLKVQAAHPDLRITTAVVHKSWSGQFDIERLQS